MARTEVIADVKSEIDNLIKKRDLIKEEIIRIQSSLEQDVQKRMSEVRVATVKLREDSEKLKLDKEEFASFMELFNKNKEKFEQDKKRIMDMQENVRTYESKIGNFVRLVKEEAGKL